MKQSERTMTEIEIETKTKTETGKDFRSSPRACDGTF